MAPPPIPGNEGLDGLLGFWQAYRTGNLQLDAERLFMLQSQLRIMPGTPPGRQNTWRQSNTQTMLASTANQSVIQINDASTVSQWMVTIEITDPDNLLPAGFYGAGLIIRSEERVENDTINKEILVGVGNGVTFFAAGRGLQIFADNPFTAALTLSYKLIESSVGTAVWQRFVQQSLSAGVETAVQVPNFARTVVILTNGAPGSLVLRQYINGIVRHQETLTTPRTTEIPVLAGAAVTLEASTAMLTTSNFNCLG